MEGWSSKAVYNGTTFTVEKISACSGIQTGPQVIKLFMLNSVEHEILNAPKCKNIKKFSFFQT